ncbi:MAG: hypothetical protein RLZZ501_1256 [Pseudomonadota bacterium]|jgi:diguanylate cyclase (GGDEF)-like protein
MTLLSALGSVTLGIRFWLMLVVVVSSSPLLAFSAYTLHALYQARAQSLIVQLTERTRSAANAIDLRIDIGLSSLTTLASSDAAQRRDLPALYRHAQSVARQSPGVLAIVLLDRAGNQIFSTREPFGTALPSTEAPDSIERVFATGQPASSGVYTGAVSRRQVVAIGVPVAIDGAVAYCLRMIVPVEVFTTVLEGLHLPGDWVVALIDAAQRNIAITHLDQDSAGRAVPPGLAAALRRGERDLISFTAPDGTEISAASVAVPRTDWVLLIGVTTRSLCKPLNQTATALAIGIALVLTMGFACALVLSGALGRQFTALARASRDFAQTGSLPAYGPAVREVVEIGRTLIQASRREQEIKDALVDAISTQRELSNRLTSARCDSLTGLPGRGLFLELVELLRREAAGARKPQALAMMLLDLDGFKAINDRFGHARGDEVLRQTAEILRHILRESDACGRLGGDEFVVCISAPADEIETVTEVIAARIVAMVGQLGEGLGCSVGVALWPPAQGNVATALHRADQAMYQAKQNGKNRFRLATDADDGHDDDPILLTS